MTEAEFIAALRPLATSEAARNLLDDVAVLQVSAAKLVITQDMIVEGVHYLPSDEAGDVAWKLLAVNLSDLAAKGAEPLGVLLSYSLGDDHWDAAFVEGLKQALDAFATPLLGGDTVSAPLGAPRSFSLTAIGTAETTPARAGAKAQDMLWVSGSIGDAGAGLKLLRQTILRRTPGSNSELSTGLRPSPEHEHLVERYRRPQPRLELGRALAPIVHAMMDVSDGLLIDTARMAHASALALHLALDAVPLSADLLAFGGVGREAQLAAATAGDDYELLFAAPESAASAILTVSDRLAIPLTRIGHFAEGAGIALEDRGEPVPLPARLGWEHGGIS